MENINFLDISYLERGNNRQKIAYHIIKRNFIFEKLRKYDPVLVGTIPINIDIFNSDLDILCCWNNKQEFIIDITRYFENEDNFKIYTTKIRNEDTVIASFSLDESDIEIFGQKVPVEQQFGYRHMIVEYNLIKEKGEEFRKEIVRLKKVGYKTEPAFAKLLDLEGDPYIELLKYESKDFITG
ncbi:MAG: DUF4269 domain-containing protein [Bacteroidales bacterium]|jgi:hypothetical protein|nr:DUF4269 domain-containing protein [Bacteroidales bacterium]